MKATVWHASVNQGSNHKHRVRTGTANVRNMMSMKQHFYGTFLEMQEQCRCDYWYFILVWKQNPEQFAFHSQSIWMTLLDCPFSLVHSYCALVEISCTGNELSRIIHVGCKKLFSQYSHLKEMLAHTTLWRNYLKILFWTKLVYIL